MYHRSVSCGWKKVLGVVFLVLLLLFCFVLGFVFGWFWVFFSRRESIICFLCHFADVPARAAHVTSEPARCRCRYLFHENWSEVSGSLCTDGQTSFWNQPSFRSAAYREKDPIFISPSFPHPLIIPTRICGVSVKMFCGLECMAMHDLDSVTPSGQSYAWSQHTELDGPAISSPTFLCSCLGITNVPRGDSLFRHLQRWLQKSFPTVGC